MLNSQFKSESKKILLEFVRIHLLEEIKVSVGCFLRITNQNNYEFNQKSGVSFSSELSKSQVPVDCSFLPRRARQ
jgi:hypothetical protein